MEDLSESELPALAARLSWHKVLMEKCTAARHIQSMKWRIPYSLLVSHRGFFQDTCHVFRCMRFFTLSQRGFHPALSVFLTIPRMPELFPIGRGKDINSFSGGQKAQKVLASRLPCLFSFLLFAQVTCLHSGCQLLPLCGGGSNPQSPSFSPLLSLSLVSFSLYR